MFTLNSKTGRINPTTPISIYYVPLFYLYFQSFVFNLLPSIVEVYDIKTFYAGNPLWPGFHVPYRSIIKNVDVNLDDIRVFFLLIFSLNSMDLIQIHPVRIFIKFDIIFERIDFVIFIQTTDRERISLLHV